MRNTLVSLGMLAACKHSGAAPATSPPAPEATVTDQGPPADAPELEATLLADDSHYCTVLDAYLRDAESGFSNVRTAPGTNDPNVWGVEQFLGDEDDPGYNCFIEYPDADAGGGEMTAGTPQLKCWFVDRAENVDAQHTMFVDRTSACLDGGYWSQRPDAGANPMTFHLAAGQPRVGIDTAVDADTGFLKTLVTIALDDESPASRPPTEPTPPPAPASTAP